jgi:hypothetical protein
MMARSNLVRVEERLLEFGDGRFHENAQGRNVLTAGKPMMETVRHAGIPRSDSGSETRRWRRLYCGFGSHP